MVAIGNFFFKYRNNVFIIFYLALFLPSWPLFSPHVFGSNYYVLPVTLGLIITVSGQLIRAATIGLDYIIRGGRNRKVYADNLVTGGMFNHGRNPLYVGNILMLTGVGILANSLLYIIVFIPLFIFIYHSIVLSEENFLMKKFGSAYITYREKVSRWFINPSGIVKTFSGSSFRWRRYLTNEHSTLLLWLVGITLITFYNYPQLTNYNAALRNTLILSIISSLLASYFIFRYFHKSGRFKEEASV